MKYLVCLFFSVNIAFAQNKDDWKYYQCPDTDISQMTMIQYGQTKEDVYLGTTDECLLKKKENPDEITCIPLEKDDVINTYLKNKEIFDELYDENTLIVNPAVYSATINFKVKYLFKREEVVEPITFYIFHSPDFCRGGWIDIERNIDGSVFIKSESFENSIYYMSMTTVKKKKDKTTLQKNGETDTVYSRSETMVPTTIELESASGIFTSENEDDLYDNTRYAIEGSTSTTSAFTNNFISLTNDRITQIIEGSYCISKANPDVMIFYWAYKSELKFSVFRDNPATGRKDKRDALKALIDGNVASTNKCNVKKK